MTANPSGPIGVFDSGIGGLTVAHAIKQALPNERLIYFGDTAHLPYGDKSAAAVQAYAVKIADLLIARGCKVIVIACNTASAVANELLKEYTASRAKVINVIEPMVAKLTGMQAGGKIGVIGTRGTIDAGVYGRLLRQAQPDIEVAELATPLLVPMIEEGFVQGRIATDVIGNYLDHPLLAGSRHLVLGCTHYPLIRDEIAGYLGGRVTVHDSSVVTAAYLRSYLEQKNLLAERPATQPDHFYISDYTDNFGRLARRFFGGDVTLEEYKLWE